MITVRYFAGARAAAGVAEESLPAGITLADIGEQLGVTRERVRQLEARALRELRTVAPALELYLKT